MLNTSVKFVKNTSTAPFPFIILPKHFISTLSSHALVLISTSLNMFIFLFVKFFSIKNFCFVYVLLLFMLEIFFTCFLLVLLVFYMFFTFHVGRFSSLLANTQPIHIHTHTHTHTHTTHDFQLLDIF